VSRKTTHVARDAQVNAREARNDAIGKLLQLSQIVYRNVTHVSENWTAGQKTILHACLQHRHSFLIDLAKSNRVTPW
jgi:hypothetical protein